MLSWLSDISLNGWLCARPIPTAAYLVAVWKTSPEQIIRWQAADRYNFTVYNLVSHLERQTLEVFSLLVAYWL